MITRERHEADAVAATDGAVEAHPTTGTDQNGEHEQRKFSQNCHVLDSETGWRPISRNGSPLSIQDCRRVVPSSRVAGRYTAIVKCWSDDLTGIE
jgi:hypothetical protein